MSCSTFSEAIFGQTKCEKERKCAPTVVEVSASQTNYFYEPGTYTFAIPDNVSKMTPTGWGAGGGGGATSGTAPSGSAGGGGGAGAFVTGTLPVKPKQVFTLQVGLGGAPGTGSPIAAGGAGTASTLTGAAYLLSAGGGGGGSTDTGVPGAGGVGSVNTLSAVTINGQDGASGASFVGGLGGSAPRGGPGGFPGGVEVAPTNGIKPGGGGGAAANPEIAQDGAAGANGSWEITFVQPDKLKPACPPPACVESDEDCDDEEDCD